MKKQTANKKEKVVLAYSGGLDTTTLIPWLKEHFDYDVVCVCIDCGQEEELTGLDKKAKKAGASKTYIIDIQDELCNDFVAPCLKANATYENEYLLGTSLARPGHGGSAHRRRRAHTRRPSGRYERVRWRRATPR